MRAPKSFANIGEAGRLGPAAVYDLTRQALAEVGSVDAIYFQGAVLDPLPVLQQIENDLKITAVASNPAMLWEILSQLGVRAPIQGTANYWRVAELSKYEVKFLFTTKDTEDQEIYPNWYLRALRGKCMFFSSLAYAQAMDKVRIGMGAFSPSKARYGSPRSAVFSKSMVSTSRRSSLAAVRPGVLTPCWRAIFSSPAPADR